jgi:hypothetical protein
MTPLNSDGKASPGAPFVPPRAKLWNSMIDAGRDYEQSRLSAGAPDPLKGRQTDLLKCLNASGSSRRRGEVLAFDGKAIADLSNEHMWLTGVAPYAGSYFGLLRDPAADGDVVSVQVSGVCMAIVDVQNSGHRRASAVEGEYVLRSDEDGPIELLYVPDELGEQECAVRFSSSIPDTGGGSGSTAVCQCLQRYGYFPPQVPEKFSHNQPYRWVFVGVLEWLAENGVVVSSFDGEDLTLSGFQLVWETDTPVNTWVSPPMSRTCPDSSPVVEDEYFAVLTEDPVYGWKLRIAMADDVEPNCDDQIDVTWVCSHPFTPQPDRTNSMHILDTESKRRGDFSPYETDYVDPPTRCNYCLFPAIDRTSLSCPSPNVREFDPLPNVVGIQTNADNVFSGWIDFPYDLETRINYTHAREAAHSIFMRMKVLRLFNRTSNSVLWRANLGFAADEEFDIDVYWDGNTVHQKFKLTFGNTYYTGSYCELYAGCGLNQSPLPDEYVPPPNYPVTATRRMVLRMSGTFELTEQPPLSSAPFNFPVVIAIKFVACRYYTYTSPSPGDTWWMTAIGVDEDTSNWHFDQMNNAFPDAMNYRIQDGSQVWTPSAPIYLVNAEG